MNTKIIASENLVEAHIEGHDYHANDVVSFNGAVFRCKQDHKSTSLTAPIVNNMINEAYWEVKGAIGNAINQLNTSLNGFLTRPKEDGTREYYNEVTGEWVNFSSGGAELLWTNASPTSNFDAQTINLDLSEYDYVIVEMKYYISTVESATSPYIKFIVPKNSNLYPLRVASEQNGVNYVSFRAITTNDSGVTFNIGSAIASNGWYTTNNGYGIPLKIYGCNISF